MKNGFCVVVHSYILSFFSIRVAWRIVKDLWRGLFTVIRRSPFPATFQWFAQEVENTDIMKDFFLHLNDLLSLLLPILKRQEMCRMQDTDRGEFRLPLDLCWKSSRRKEIIYKFGLHFFPDQQLKANIFSQPSSFYSYFLFDYPLNQSPFI